MAYQLDENVSLKIIDKDGMVELYHVMCKNSDDLIYNNAISHEALNQEIFLSSYYEKDLQVFAIYYNNKIIGVASINEDRKLPIYDYIRSESSFSKVRYPKGTCETALWIDSTFRGKGIGPKVGKFINDWYFQNTDHEALFKSCYKWNRRSKRCIEKQGLRLLFDYNKGGKILTYVLERKVWESKSVGA